jgi:hypothetical protein
MFSLVPTLRAFAESLIIVITGLLDEALQTDETTHLESVLIQPEKSQQPRYASVAIAEWVNAQEVENQCGDSYKRLDLSLIQDRSIRETKLLYGCRRLGNRNWPETNCRRHILAKFDDLVLFLLPFPSVRGALLRRRVQTLQEFGRDLKLSIVTVNQI